MNIIHQTDDRGVLLHELPHAGGPLPSRCVRVAPPSAPTGKVARWVSSVPDYLPGFGEPRSGEWVVEADHRKTPLFLVADGAPYSLGTEVDGQAYGGTGELPAWLTDQARPSLFHSWQGGAWVLDEAAQLADAKERKLREIDSARDDALAGGFEYAGHTYDSDEKSIQRISAIATLTLLDPEYTTPYITQDNQIITLQADDIAGLGAAAAAHEASMVFQARALKDQVLAATTLSEVESIAWTRPT